MLKIAEYNTITGEKIDLKELEKYGFTLRYSQYDGKVNQIIQEWGYPFVDKKDRPFITFVKRKKYISRIPLWNRKFDYHFKGEFIIPSHSRNREEFFDTLYDLIKDGLVEKVDE